MQEKFSMLEKDAFVERFCKTFCSNKSSFHKYVMGRNEQARLIASNFDVSGFIDDFTEETGFMGKPIVRTQDVDDDSLVVVCSTMRPLSAIRMLESNGIQSVLDYVSLFRWLNQPQFSLEPFRQFQSAYDSNKELFERIYDHLADDISRQTFRDLVGFRCSGDLEYMRAYSFDPVGQYFEDFVTYSENEVFVDAGGYDGLTTREFVRHCPDYKKILFFEPSDENMSAAKENLAAYSNVEYFSKGLSDTEGVVRFDADAGSASTFSPTGSIEIEVGTLDALVPDAITFIKMDIEGAEGLAIDGCRKHIAKDHPKLAIAVYHKVNDFWELPDKILYIRNDYKLYMRHYTEGTDETIMYFVPY